MSFSTKPAGLHVLLQKNQSATLLPAKLPPLTQRTSLEALNSSLENFWFPLAPEICSVSKKKPHPSSLAFKLKLSLTLFFPAKCPPFPQLAFPSKLHNTLKKSLTAEPLSPTTLQLPDDTTPCTTTLPPASLSLIRSSRQRPADSPSRIFFTFTGVFP